MILLFLSGAAAYSAWKEYGAAVMSVLRKDEPQMAQWLDFFIGDGNYPYFSYEQGESGAGLYLMFMEPPKGLRTQKILRDYFTEERVAQNYVYRLRG